VDNQKEELLNSIQRMNQEIAKTQEEVVADRRAKEQLEKEKADILIAGESEIAQLRQVIEHLLAEG
jgi:predicted  nucleic acid-binding Zn-ribbon protein